MSTRNLEFLTPSRWLPTTRGSRHLIAPTATGPSLSLSPSLPLPSPRREWSPFSSSSFRACCRSLPLKYTSNHALVRRLFYKLPCVAIGLAGCAHREPRRHPLERARKKKRRGEAGFVIGQRLHRRDGSEPPQREAAGQPGPPMHVDIRPDTYTPSHYFQFMFLPILKSANFRGPPAGRSSAAKIYMSCV